MIPVGAALAYSRRTMSPVREQWEQWEQWEQ